MRISIVYNDVNWKKFFFGISINQESLNETFAKKKKITFIFTSKINECYVDKK